MGLTEFTKACHKEASTLRNVSVPSFEQKFLGQPTFLHHFFFFLLQMQIDPYWGYTQNHIFQTAFTSGVNLWSWVPYSWLLTLQLPLLWIYYNVPIYIQNKEPRVIPSSEILVSLIVFLFPSCSRIMVSVRKTKQFLPFLFFLSLLSSHTLILK